MLRSVMVLEIGKVDNRDRMIRRRFQEQDTPRRNEPHKMGGYVTEEERSLGGTA